MPCPVIPRTPPGRDTPNIPGKAPPTPDCPFHEEILPPDAQHAPNRGVESPAFSPTQPHKRCPRALPFFRPNPSSTSTSQKSWSRRLCTKPVCYKHNVALQRNSAGTRCFSNKGKTQIGLVLASSADSPGTKKLTALVAFAQELGLARELLVQTPQVHHGNLHPPAKIKTTANGSPALPSHL